MVKLASSKKKGEKRLESVPIPRQQQVYRGVKALGYYEAVYDFIIHSVIIFVLAYLVIASFGTHHWMQTTAKILAIVPHTHASAHHGHHHPTGHPHHAHHAHLLLRKDHEAKTVTLEIPSPDKNTLVVDYTTHRSNLHVGDFVRVYIDPTNYSHITDHKPNSFNDIGITTIIVSSFLFLFVVGRLVLTFVFPGAAAATPILKAVRGL